MDIKTDNIGIIPNAGGGTWPPDKDNKLSSDDSVDTTSGTSKTNIQAVLQDDIVTLSTDATTGNKT